MHGHAGKRRALNDEEKTRDNDCVMPQSFSLSGFLSPPVLPPFVGHAFTSWKR